MLLNYSFRRFVSNTILVGAFNVCILADGHERCSSFSSRWRCCVKIPTKSCSIDHGIFIWSCVHCHFHKPIYSLNVLYFFTKLDWGTLNLYQVGLLREGIRHGKSYAWSWISGINSICDWVTTWSSQRSFKLPNWLIPGKLWESRR